MEKEIKRLEEISKELDGFEMISDEKWVEINEELMTLQFNSFLSVFASYKECLSEIKILEDCPLEVSIKVSL